MLSKHPDWENFRDAPVSGNLLQRWLKSRFHYVNYPFLMSYRGFGNLEKFVVQGHVFRGLALERPKKRKTLWRNFKALIKMFLVRVVPKAQVQLLLNGKTYQQTTDENGFFEFVIEGHSLSKGWHSVRLELIDRLVEGQEEVSVKTPLRIETDFEYGLISDIDDTFLVSHATRPFRKLYLLMTKNSETRKPFKGVVHFYQALSEGVSAPTNPFFYVSSSEWNLYDFLIEFMRFHKLPKGVLQLKELKDQWLDFFRSGGGSHNHKEVKIRRILQTYPDESFILLGDNGQHDPQIYLNIAREFPQQIKAIYIRAVRKSHREKVQQILDEIDRCDIPSLQFKSSADAMEHAKKQSFIK